MKEKIKRLFRSKGTKIERAIIIRIAELEKEAAVNYHRSVDWRSPFSTRDFWREEKEKANTAVLELKGILKKINQWA